MKVKQALRYSMLRLLMMNSVQRLMLPFGRELKPKRWIFILGCYNSATTLLASILRNHPLIGGLPNEGAFLTNTLPYPEQFGWPRMWCQCLPEMQSQFGLQDKDIAQNIKKQWSVLFPKNTPNLIEKSISNITRMQFLQDNFNPAYFIYIVRNGYVVSKGIQKKANYTRWHSKYKDKGYPIELCAEQWKTSDDLWQKDSPNLQRVLHIQYEHLADHTEETVKKITDFLGIPSMSAKTYDQQWSIDGVSSSIVNMNPIGLKRLSDEDFKRIDAVASDSLQKYGYSREG